jgi:hypothetical protein
MVLANLVGISGLHALNWQDPYLFGGMEPAGPTAHWKGDARCGADFEQIHAASEILIPER